MVICLPGFIPDDFADQLVADLSSLSWHTGDAIDPDYGERVKRNLELKEQDSPVVQRYAKILLEAIVANSALRNKTFAHKGKLPQFNKYADGGAYHRHSDSAFIGSPEIRTDFSVTIFLNDPGEYEGGELTLELPSGEVRRIKEKKGTLCVTPPVYCITLRR